MSRQNSVGSWIVAVVVVVGVVAAGVYLARKAIRPDTSATSAATPAPTTSNSSPAAATSSIQHPIAEASSPAEASTAPLPALGDSDASVASSLYSLANAGDLRTLLISSQIIPHIVATIDALPRRGVGTLVLPLHTPKGSFVTATGDAGITMGDRNVERYAPYMQVVQGVDAKALVAWYVRMYPLFQEAYRQLGYPRGYFNDRLIVVINNLLSAPDLAQPAALTPSSYGAYAYVDPSLESLSAGQKALLRVGPANEARLKAKLREIRALLAGSALHSNPPSAAR